MSEFEPKPHFLSYYHRYRMLAYRPELADIYDKAHSALKEEPNPALEEEIVEFIDRHNLRNRAYPNDYDWRDYKQAVKLFNDTGEETFPRDKGYETRGFTLSAFHQMKMHQSRPYVGLHYARLHDKLALDTQNDSVIEAIIELIDDHKLRASPIPFGYDVEEMQKSVDRLLRVNRDRDLNGEL